jgi:hypothetical protein
VVLSQPVPVVLITAPDAVEIVLANVLTAPDNALVLFLAAVRAVLSAVEHSMSAVLIPARTPNGIVFIDVIIGVVVDEVKGDVFKATRVDCVPSNKLRVRPR